MADYSPNPTWNDQVTIISKAALDNYEDAHAQAVRKAPATAQTVIPAADVIGLLLQGRAAGAKSALNAESMELVVAIKTANYTLTNRESVCLMSASGGSRTVTLPAAAGCAGRLYAIQKTDSTTNTVVVDGNASETINGATTQTLRSQYASLVIQSDGTNWVILAGSTPPPSIVAKTSAYTATSGDRYITCSASGGAFTVTLPAAASSNGLVLTIKKTDSSVNAVTIDANASETIDGALTRVLLVQYASIEIVCDGTTWHILG